MTKYYILSGFIAAALIASGCYNDKADELYPQPAICDTTDVSYASEIQPIFSAKCANSGCHDAGTMSSGIQLENHSGAAAAASGGRMIGAITHASGFSQMPKGMPKLSDCDISKIIAWVNAGAPNN